MNLIVLVALLVSVFSLVRIIQLTIEVRRNRNKLVSIENFLGNNYSTRAGQCHGFFHVLKWQWWAYGPLLLLAALAAWRLGPGFEMYLLLGSAVFWIVTAE